MLLDFGSTVSSLNERLWGGELGYPRRVPRVHVSLVWLNLARDTEFKVGPIDHIDPRLDGVLGTDILASASVTLDYRHRIVWISDGQTFCSDDVLAALGWLRFDVASFYRGVSYNSKPITAGQRVVLNMPVIPFQIGEVTGQGVLDTGFDDSRRPGGVIPNEQFIAAIEKSGHILIDSGLPVPFDTCQPSYRPMVRPQRVSESMRFSVGQKGALVTSSLRPRMWVLDGQEWDACGGFTAPFKFPAAILGPSFLEDFGLVVFDAPRSAIWVAKNQSR